MEYGRSLDNRHFAAYSRLFASNGEWAGSLGTYRGPAAIQAAMEKSFAQIAFAGRYEDTLIRENGQWKFLRRVAKAAREVSAPAK